MVGWLWFWLSPPRRWFQIGFGSAKTVFVMSPVLFLLLWFFAYFLAPFVCIFGFLVSWFVFGSVEICRYQSFQFSISGAREFGKAGGSGYG
jgi:hypothetical protein